MELTLAPRMPWHWLAAAAALLAAALVLATLLLSTRRAALGRSWPGRIISAVLFLLAFAALAAAAFNPLLLRQRDPERLHLSVVLDISPSMLRPEGRWAEVRGLAAGTLDAALDMLPAELRAEASGSIVAFRNTAGEVEPGTIALDDLPDRVRSVPPDYVNGDGSDLADGLLRAGERVGEAGGRGAVLIVSDGLETEGDARAAAADLARRGIPVYVLPVRSEAAELAIMAADLPRQAFAGGDTLLRGTVWNARQALATAQISITLNTGLSAGSPRVSAAMGLTEPQDLELAARATALLRAPLAFGGHGLQFADLALSYDAGQGLQRRRFFTHVKRPLEILSVAGDRRWQSAFPEGAAKMTEIAPGQLAEAGDLRAYDAVVISAVAGGDFAPGELAAIAEAVERDGLGLMVFNGDHGGADQEAATVLKSYDDTPLAPLLPVISGPRPFEEEPPSRHVIFLIDASGSMDGWGLDKAKEIAGYIIENELRPADKVDIIAFNTAALHLVQGQETTPSAVPGILGQLASIQAGGGTDPTEALRLLEGKQFTECGLIFLSDGEFSAVNLRPDCRATAFSIGGSYSPALAQFADPFPVDPSFNPSGITIPYFSPEKRTRLWEPGEFTPISTAVLSRTVVRLPVPELSLPGSAISHAKPEAFVVAVRPKLKDPLLAYAERGAGYVGVMTSAVVDDWLQSDTALDAVEEWVRQVAPYAARDRYDFQLRDDGAHMRLRVALVAEDGRVPEVGGLEIRLEQPGRAPVPIPVTGESGSPATFLAELRPERGPAASEATLVIRESSGGDRLARPQRIPLIIPPAGSVTPPVSSEAYSSGLDEGLLMALAEAGGGARLDDPQRPVALLRASPPGSDSQPLWPWLLALGGLLYLGAIAIRRTGL